MKKRAVCFFGLSLVATAGRAQEILVATPTTIPYSATFQSQLIGGLTDDKTALLFLSIQALQNPHETIHANQQQFELIDYVIQQIGVSLIDRCRNIQRASALRSLEILVPGSASDKVALSFEELIVRVQKDETILFDEEARFLLLDLFFKVSNSLTEKFKAQQVAMKTAASNLDKKQKEFDSITQEIALLEDFVKKEASWAANNIDDSLTYWTEIAKLVPKPKETIGPDAINEAIDLSAEPWKGRFLALVNAEKRKKKLELQTIEKDNRLTKLLGGLYDQKLTRVRLELAVKDLTSANEDEKNKFDKLKRMAQSRTLAIQTSILSWPRTGHSKSAIAFEAHVLYSLHKALLLYDGADSILHLYEEIEQPAKGTFTPSSKEFGAPTAAGDRPSVSRSVRSAGKRAGATATAPFDAATMPTDPYKRPGAQPHYPASDDQGKRKATASSLENIPALSPADDSAPKKAGGAVGATSVLPPQE